MAGAHVDRYHKLAALTARIARAAAELEAARADTSALPGSQAADLEDLSDRLQALHVLLANDVERAWNAAEAEARRERRAVLMGRVHDAVSAETTLPDPGQTESWQRLGPTDLLPHRDDGGTPSDGTEPR
jgi:hypothetical protein